MYPRRRPLALALIHDLQTRLDRLITDSPRAKRAGDAHQRVVLLAVRDATTLKCLERPAALARFRETKTEPSDGPQIRDRPSILHRTACLERAEHRRFEI